MNNNLSQKPGPIGIFDSGYGGLTIFEKIKNELPQYDYIYLGDNARAPYGTRPFEFIYEFTLQAVKFLFEQGCHLVILACNTASAEALRSIQQKDLIQLDEARRVLGVIRPTVEVIREFTKTQHVGVFGTLGTINSLSYPLEIAKISPDIVVTGMACPMWVPLVEHNEFTSEGADYFVRVCIEQIMDADPQIDTIILGCTHYPLLMEKINKYLPEHVRVISQGDLVATSLADYLYRHPEIETKCSTNGKTTFLTTESPERFANAVSIFLNEKVKPYRVTLI